MQQFSSPTIFFPSFNIAITTYSARSYIRILCEKIVHHNIVHDLFLFTHSCAGSDLLDDSDRGTLITTSFI